MRLRDGRPTQHMRWGVTYAAELNLLRESEADGGVYCLWSWLCALLSNRTQVRIRTTYLAAVTGYSEPSIRRFGGFLETVGLVERSRAPWGAYEWSLRWPDSLREQAQDPNPDLELSDVSDLESWVPDPKALIPNGSMDKSRGARTDERTSDHPCALKSKDPKELNHNLPPSPLPGGLEVVDVSESEVLTMLEVLAASEPGTGASNLDHGKWQQFCIDLAQSDTARPTKQRDLARRLASGGFGSNIRLEAAVILEASRQALRLYLDPPAYHESTDG